MTRAQQLRAEVSEIAHESFDGALVVKTLGREGEETERFAAQARELRDVNVRAGRVRAAFDPALAALPEPRRPGRARRRRQPGARRAPPTPATWSPSPTCSRSCPSRSARSAGCSASSPAASSGFRRVSSVLEATGEMQYGDAALPAARRGGAGARLEVEHLGYAYDPDQPLLADVTLHRRARPHGRAGRRHRLRQEHADHADDPARRPATAAGSCSTAPTCATSPAASWPATVAIVPQTAFLFDDDRARQRHARRRRHRRGGLGGAARRAGRRVRRRAARTASTPGWGSAAPRCRAASGSGSRWRARWCAGPGC